MRVEVVPARSAKQLEPAIARAVDTLRVGGLVVHPTETVYGIGGDGSAESNRLIQRVKRRQRAQPFILLSPDLDSLRRAFPAVEWPPAADALVDRFWPGPLTIVARCPGGPKELLGPGEGLAVRVSSDRTVAGLLERWGRPMTSTSANLAGRAAARTVERAGAVFGDRDDLTEIDVPVLALDAGATPGTRGSTIVSFVDLPPRILREGPIRREQVEPLLREAG